MLQDKGLIFGLYATTPDPLSTDKGPDIDLIRRARSEISIIGGLEIPYYGRTDAEKYADAELMDAMDERWTHVITTVPAAMLHQKENPSAGLASRSADGRAEAVKRIRGASALVRRLNDKLGRKSVSAVQVCSSPSSSASSDRTCADSLRRSLEELSSHDWDGAALNVEHCDAKTGLSLEKALLSLGDEISAIESANKAGADCGVVINWGRSAIEFRDASRVVEHIDAAKRAGLLKGVVFSGATDDPASAYGVWKDTHPAVAMAESGVADSLMTVAEISNSARVAGSENAYFLGCKVHIPPGVTYSIGCAIRLNMMTGAAIMSSFQYV